MIRMHDVFQRELTELLSGRQLRDLKGQSNANFAVHQEDKRGG